MPLITATGYDRLGEATNLPQDRHDNTYEWADSLSWTTGRHTVKFGAEIRHFQEGFLFDSSARGTINFTPFYTAQASVSSAGVVNALTGTGNAIADLLLGFPDTSSVSRSFAGINANTVAGLRQTSTNLFAQDDFRVLPNLTLNLGIRWEYNAPTTDKYNHLATFDPNFPNSTPLPYLRISTPQAPNIYNSSKREFAPRFGLAWTPVRIEDRHPRRVRHLLGHQDSERDPELQPDGAVPHRLQLQPEHQRRTPTSHLANPYGGTGTPAIPSASWVENPFRDGYMQQWNFNVQHQFSNSMGVTAGYVGSKGTHLDRAYDYNEPAPTASFTQALRKYPMYASISVRSPSASSIYHAAAVERGEALLARPELPQRVYVFQVDRRRIAVERLGGGRHELPPGARPFHLRHAPPLHLQLHLRSAVRPRAPVRRHQSTLVNTLFGGWQTNGIVTIQSGNPLDPSTGLQFPARRPARAPTSRATPTSSRTTRPSGSTSRASRTARSGRYGTAGRDIIIGPPTHAFDMAPC